MSEINLTPEELESMLDRAAKRGAKQALSSIGLHDATAAKDINEIETNIKNIKIIENKKTVKFKKEFELDWNKNEEVFKAKNEPDINASNIVKECKIGQGA